MSTAVGSAIDFFSNWLTNAYNKRNVDKTNQANQQAVDSTNAMNQQINQANIDFQQQENEIARQREDNAVWRRAQDLVHAGLSKTLAAGSPASANVMQAPQATIGMQHAKYEPFKAQAYQGFETAMNHKEQNEITRESLELSREQLGLERDKIAEEIRSNKAKEEENTRHNIATEEESKRYHDIENEWRHAELDQDSLFHDDAVKLSWAQHELETNKYLTDSEQKEYQNLWYNTQIKLARNEDRRAFMRLTSDLAEASAKTALYASEVKFNDANIQYVKTHEKYVASQIATELIQQNKLKNESKQIYINSVCKMFDLCVAIKEGTPVGGQVPSQTSMDFTASQNALDRKNSLDISYNNVAMKILQIGFSAIVGSKINVNRISAL